MTDEKTIFNRTMTTVRRKVDRDPRDRLYYVRECEGNYWVKISRGYVHSTSCYAYLGRLTSKVSASEEDKGV